MLYTIKSGLYQETLVLASTCISMMITKIYIYLVVNKKVNSYYKFTVVPLPDLFFVHSPLSRVNNKFAVVHYPEFLLIVRVVSWAIYDYQ